VVLLELLEGLLLQKVHLRDFLPETFFLLFLLQQKFLVALIVCVNLLIMFTLLYFELLCMQTSQVLQILRSPNFNLLLIMLNTAAAFDISSALL